MSCLPIDFDAQVTPEAIQAMDLAVTDDVAQLNWCRTMACVQTTPPVHGDLGEVVGGEAPGRRNPAERTIAIHLGLTIEDVVTVVRICERAARLGLGRRLPL